MHVGTCQNVQPRKIKSNENVKVLSYLLMLQSLCSCYTLSRIIPRTGEYHGDK